MKVVLLAEASYRCVVESECLPRRILERYREAPFQISLESGPKFKVRLASYNPSTISRFHFAGKLIPVRSPFLVAEKDVQLNLARFDVVNFTSFFNEVHLSTDDKSTKSRNLEVTISEAMASEDRKQFKQMGGYAITHQGKIQSSDNTDFSVGEVSHVVEHLSRYLSFSQGARVAVIRVRGTRTSSKEIPIVWGSSHVDNSGECQGVLYTANSGWEPLSSAWSGFLDIVDDQSDGEQIRRALDWYLLANNSDFGSGLVLGQAALELLASNSKKEKTAEKIGEAIERLGVDRAVPLQCENLLRVAKRNSWDCGPISITKIRNDLVHPKRKHIGVCPEAQLEARDLALWYIELLLLNRIQYHGRYKVRSTIATGTAYADVPWMKGRPTNAG